MPQDQADASRAPKPSSPGRSRNLAAIHRADTRPEVALRSALHAAGRRFRKDFRLELPGGRVRPDIVFTRAKVAVFVDGCFWHVCPDHGHQPTNNEWYWTPKLKRNVERDRRADAVLADAGWSVVRIWEHVAISEAVGMVNAALDRSSVEHVFESTSRVRSVWDDTPHTDPRAAISGDGTATSGG